VSRLSEFWFAQTRTVESFVPAAIAGPLRELVTLAGSVDRRGTESLPHLLARDHTSREPENGAISPRERPAPWWLDARLLLDLTRDQQDERNGKHGLILSRQRIR